MEELTFQVAEGEALAGVGGIALELQLITVWTRTDPMQPALGRYRVDIELPNNEVKEAAAILDIDLRSFQRLRSRVGIGGIPYAGPGRYEFVVKLEANGEWDIQGRVPFDLNSESATGQPPGAAL
jgi:hypothetical protein